jgi:twinkle protein
VKHETEEAMLTDITGREIVVPKIAVRPNFITAMDLAAEVQKLYADGLPPGASTGWGNIDALYTVGAKQWTLVTGIPGHGKSEWLDALMVNLASAVKPWRFAVYSPENSPQEVHIAKLLQKRLSKPFKQGPTERMTRAEMAEGLGWIEEHFGFIRPAGDQPANIEMILEECWLWCYLEPNVPTGIVIDPWNELEHVKPHNQSETEYISDTLSRIRRFARSRNVHIWIVAHPAKLMKDRDGKRPIPTGYDVSGSAHWLNKADNVITVWRDPADENVMTQVHVQKVRFSHIGRVGVAELKYNRMTGQFQMPLGMASKRYREASEGEL